MESRSKTVARAHCAGLLDGAAITAIVAAATIVMASHARAEDVTTGARFAQAQTDEAQTGDRGPVEGDEVDADVIASERNQGPTGAMTEEEDASGTVAQSGLVTESGVPESSRLGVDAFENGDPDAIIDTDQMTVGELLAHELVSSEGEDVGDAESVIRLEDKLYLVVSRGGFLGVGDKEVAVPLENVSIRDDRLVLDELTEQDLAEMKDHDIEPAAELPMGEEISLPRGDGS